MCPLVWPGVESAEVQGAPLVAVVEELGPVPLQQAAVDRRVPFAGVGDEGGAREGLDRPGVVVVQVGHDDDADAQRIDAARGQLLGDGRALVHAQVEGDRPAAAQRLGDALARHNRQPGVDEDRALRVLDQKARDRHPGPLALGGEDPCAAQRGQRP
jgi:hypothetical protein